MDNKEEILEALDEFAKHPAGKISHVLEQYLNRIATTGVTVFPWTKLKPLLIQKLDSVVQEFQERSPMCQQSPSPNIEHVTFEAMRKRLIDDINQFNGIPFTIQRLCELVTNPMKHYQKTDKYMRGVEKNLVVVTTVDPYGNRIVNENKVELNGIEVTSTRDHLTQTDPLNSSFLPPVPVNSPTTSSTGSWFSSLSNVVDSPSSYPNWTNQQETSSGEASSAAAEKRSNAAEESDSSVERPRKMLRLDDGCSNAAAETGRDMDETNDDAEAGGEEQKAIAPLLTQLLSNSGAMEQTGTDEQQTETSQSDEATGTDESVRVSETVDPIETSSTEPVVSNAVRTTTTHAAEHVVNEPAAAAADDACDSTMAFNNCSADDNSNPDTSSCSGDNQLSESDVTASDERVIATTRSMDLDPTRSNADSSGLQSNAQRDCDMGSGDFCVKHDPAESDATAAVTLPTSHEWSSSSVDDSNGNVDSASNADSDCGVDSLLETSDMNVSYADAESGELAEDSPAERESEQEGTSEAQMAEEQGGSETDMAGVVVDRQDEEQVGSSHWESTSPSPMDAE